MTSQDSNGTTLVPGDEVGDNDPFEELEDADEAKFGEDGGHEETKEAGDGDDFNAAHLFVFEMMRGNIQDCLLVAASYVKI